MIISDLHDTAISHNKAMQLLSFIILMKKTFLDAFARS